MSSVDKWGVLLEVDSRLRGNDAAPDYERSHPQAALEAATRALRFHTINVRRQGNHVGLPLLEAATQSNKEY